jgi:hypothetical protein
MHLVKHSVGRDKIMSDTHSVRFHGVACAVGIEANVNVIVICDSFVRHL